MKEFSTVAELREHYRGVKARLNALQPPAPRPQPPAREFAPEPAPEPPVPIAEPEPPPPSVLPVRPHLRPFHRIVRVVGEHFEVPPEMIRSSYRAVRVLKARMIVVHLATDLLGMSRSAIGRELGGRDHTTVIHSLAVVARRIAIDGDYADTIAMLRAKLLEESSETPYDDAAAAGSER